MHIPPAHMHADVYVDVAVNQRCATYALEDGNAKHISVHTCINAYLYVPALCNNYI